MTRGSRKDLPTTGSYPIERDGLIKPWAYWEKRFGDDFNEPLRRELQNIQAGFLNIKREYDQPGRITAKQLDRNLNRLRKRLEQSKRDKTLPDSKSDADTWDFVQRTTLGIRGKSDVQLIDIAREQLRKDPDDVLLAPVKPEIACAVAIYDLLNSSNLNVRMSSSQILSGFPGNDPYPDCTPVEELICSVVLGIENPETITASQIVRIKKAVQRHKDT